MIAMCHVLEVIYIDLGLHILYILFVANFFEHFLCLDENNKEESYTTKFCNM
jgi:hypothetical protein